MTNHDGVNSTKVHLELWVSAGGLSNAGPEYPK